MKGSSQALKYELVASGAELVDGSQELTNEKTLGLVVQDVVFHLVEYISETTCHDWQYTISNNNFG